MNEEKEQPYNRIVIVGNGFDLAMGVNTSYKGFIFDLQKKFPHYSSDLFNKLLKQLYQTNWIDIEQFYYDRIKLFLPVFLSGNKKRVVKELKMANESMDFLTGVLDKYIQKQQELFQFNRHSTVPARPLLTKARLPLPPEQTKYLPEYTSTLGPGKILYLNFNYTNILSKQIPESNDKQDHVHLHIHGEAGNEEHPIVFGYGDDTGAEYQQMELTGEDEFLKKIKAFQYPNTNHYHRLLSFLDDVEFDVFIVGHSCGLSDRTLLKTIFEHDNCLAIKNFHYRGKEEDFYKRLAISRHFEDKVKMRARLLPYDPDAQIPQVKREEA